MYFEKSYIVFSPNLIINSISNYRNLMIKFINKYLEIYKDENSNNINDSIIYSKYYLYYKINNCIYDNTIMNIIYNVEYHLNNYSLNKNLGARII